MNSAIQKLANYLSLEAERGYDNGSVVGGLDRMLEPWRDEALESGVAPELIDVVTARLGDYPRLSAKSREETLHGLWNRVRAEYPELGPSPEVSEQTGSTRSEGKKAVVKLEAEQSSRSEDPKQPEGSAVPAGASRVKSTGTEVGIDGHDLEEAEQQEVDTGASDLDGMAGDGNQPGQVDSGEGAAEDSSPGNGSQKVPEKTAAKQPAGATEKSEPQIDEDPASLDSPLTSVSGNWTEISKNPQKARSGNTRGLTLALASALR